MRRFPSKLHRPATRNPKQRTRLWCSWPLQAPPDRVDKFLRRLSVGRVCRARASQQHEHGQQQCVQHGGGGGGYLAAAAVAAARRRTGLAIAALGALLLVVLVPEHPEEAGWAALEAGGRPSACLFPPRLLAAAVASQVFVQLL